MALDFVGMDPDSPKNECPSIHVDPDVRDMYVQGRKVTDPEVLKQITENSPLADDEAVVWLPARMAPTVLEAASGSYESGRRRHGEPTFETLLANAHRSAVHLEMRDTYDTSDPAFAEWQALGTCTFDWDDWVELIGSATARGVRVRRARVVSEPATDYIRWEHSITGGNIDAGEEVRWLPRDRAFDLMLPGADFWMFDQRIVRFNFNAGDGTSLRRYKHVSDPRAVTPIVAAFEQVWERATPHEEYRPR